LGFRKESGTDLIKRYYDLIKEAEAVLVLNVEKNGIKNYIGGNTLIEMAFAYVLDKKIYLLNGILDMPYKDEIMAMNPILLGGKIGSIDKKK